MIRSQLPDAARTAGRDSNWHLTFLAILLAVAAWVSPAAAQSTGMLSSGQTVRGSLKQTPAGVALLTADGKSSIPLGLMREVRLDSSTAVLLPTRPMRRFLLPGGDLVTGELAGWSAGVADLRLRGGIAARTEAIVGMEQPPRQRLLFYEDFASGPASAEFLTPPAALAFPPQSRQEFSWSEPIDGGLVQFWFAADAVALASLTCELSDSRAIRLRTSPQELILQSGLEPLPGWRCFSIYLSTDTLRVAIDGQVVGESAGVGKVSSLRLSRGAAGGVLSIDDVLVVQDEPGTTAWPWPAGSGDAVQLHSGDEFFGKLTSLTPERVSLTTRLSSETWLWRDVRRLVRSPPASAARGVGGLICRIELTAVFGTDSFATDRLFGAIIGIADDGLQFEHPWLGALSIPLRHVSRIQPEFQGRCWPVDFSTHHLGDEVRDDFSVPTPDGTSLDAVWTTEAVPEGELVVALQVAELEPAGPAAQASSTLDELRAGGLVTLLLVNGQPVTVLNKHLNQRADVRSPLPLRIAVPRNFWKVGANEIRIVQRPHRSEPGSFDDCLVSHLRVESPSPRAKGRNGNDETPAGQQPPP